MVCVVWMCVGYVVTVWVVWMCVEVYGVSLGIGGECLSGACDMGSADLPRHLHQKGVTHILALSPTHPHNT